MLLPLLALTLLAPVAPQGAPSSPPSYPAKVEKTLYATHDLRGKPAPKLAVTTWLDDAAPKTAKKIVVIDFWATWCPPCRATIPELNAIQKRFKDDVVVIGISDEPVEKLRAFAKATPFSYAIASDPKKTMDAAIGIEGIPHVLVVTPDGIVRWQGFPLDDKDPLSEDVIARIVAAWKAKA